jgi:hypothetical protein
MTTNDVTPSPAPNRYLAELSKFRLAAPSSALLRLKLLLDDFNGSNIDAACALVEGAGRFFMRLPGAVRAPSSHVCLPCLVLHVGTAFRIRPAFSFAEHFGWSGMAEKGIERQK